jgi:hypothetical protein
MRPSQQLSNSASQHLSISASQHLSISASQHLSISASQHLSISALSALSNVLSQELIQCSVRSPSQFPIRAPADSERNPDGFIQQPIHRPQTTNGRQQPAASSSSVTPPAPAVQILANRSWAGAGLEDPANGSLQHVIRDDSRRSLQRRSQPVKAQHLPAHLLRPPISDWLLFSPRKKVNISMPTIMQSSWYEHMPAHLSILFIVRLANDAKLMNHLL